MSWVIFFAGLTAGFIIGVLFTRRNLKRVNQVVERLKQEQEEFKRRIG